MNKLGEYMTRIFDDTQRAMSGYAPYMRAVNQSLLKAPTPLPGAQSIRCSTCNESLTVCKGAHGSAAASPQRGGYDPAVLSSHKADCPRVTGEDGSCWCRVNDPCAI